MKTKFVKIGKELYIVEDTDRWSRPLGTFSVVSAIGYYPQDKWKEIQEFEGYDDHGGLEEAKSAQEQLKAGVLVSDLKIPIIQRLLKHGSMMKQFTICKNNPETVKPGPDGSFENSYLSTYAVFNQRTLKEWTTADDVRLAKLESECKRMNAASTPIVYGD